MADVQFIPLSRDGRHHTTIGVQTGPDDFELPSLTDDKADVPRAASVQPQQEPYEPYGGPGQAYNDYYQKMMSYRELDQYATPRVYIPPTHPNRSQEPGPPVFRAGRLGAPWRHIRQCTGNLGNHIMFVDGVVKQEDMRRFPPFGYSLPEQDHTYLSPRIVPMKKGPPPADHNKIRGRFQDHARKGFKYWQDDKRPTQPPDRPIEGWAEVPPSPEMFVPQGYAPKEMFVPQGYAPRGPAMADNGDEMEPLGYVPVVHWMPTWRPAQARPRSPKRSQTPHPHPPSTRPYSPSPPSDRPSSPQRPASRAGPRPLGMVPATPIHTVRSAPTKKSKKSGRASVLSVHAI